MKQFTSGKGKAIERQNPHRAITQAVNDGWVVGGGFFASIMSGFLLGYLGDRWLGTDPWLVVAGIIAGSINGFYRLYDYAKGSDDGR